MAQFRAKYSQGLTDTFTTDIDVKQIVVETDYFTSGSIQVKGVNDIATAYSETASQNFERGFAFTNQPSSPIPFGQTATYTFSVTPINGVNFEWEVPSGWQINGQGNILEGTNMNSINVTTTSFCSNSSVVRVRLKKDNEVSDWFNCQYPGVTLPTIISNTSPIYQYLPSTFSISNINTANIHSITCLDNGVSFVESQGSDFKVIFLHSGTFTMNVSILMSGCSTPVIRQKVVTVNANQISISGPAATYSGAYPPTLE